MSRKHPQQIQYKGATYLKVASRPGDMAAANELREMVRGAVGEKVHDLSISWWWENWSDASIPCSDDQHAEIVSAIEGAPLAGKRVAVGRDQGLQRTYISLE